MAGVIAGVTLLIVAQHAVSSDNEWLELSRYLPFVGLLLPALAAAVAAFWLGRRWVVASVATLALLTTLGMGLQWHPRDDGTQRVRVMTYNIKVQDSRTPRVRVQALAAEVARHDPDILVMQDADGLLQGRGDPALPMDPVFGLPHVHAAGQYVVASRFDLHGCGTWAVVMMWVLLHACVP